jgi:PAS domain S-box-containing protein
MIPSNEKSELPKAKILVVDDHQASRYATARILRAAGFETIEAETGGEALALATDNVDLIVLDVNLPDMDGFEVCRRLRSRRETAYLPITYLSATFTSSSDMAHGLRAGADSYLAHPADPMVLTATIRALLFARDADTIKRRADARFRTVFDLASSGIAILDHDMVFTDVNPAFCELARRDRAALLCKPLADVIAEDGCENLNTINSELADRNSWAGITSITRGDGTRGQTEWRIVVEADTGARFAMATDITERLRNEEERERLLASERVARAEAEHTNQLKDEFLAMLSHELRNPLGAVLGWASVLRHTPDLPASVTHGIEIIERNARIQAHLTSDLLDFAGIRFGKMRLELAALDPGAVVDAAVEVVTPQAEAKQIQMIMTERVPNVTVMGDEARLQQVFWNLLSNAIKFTPAGGQVRVASRLRENCFELEVTDTGKGFLNVSHSRMPEVPRASLD